MSKRRHPPLHSWMRAPDHGGQICRKCGAGRSLANVNRPCPGRGQAVMHAPKQTPYRDDGREITERDVVVDDASNKPMWYAWPKECPMYAEKVAAGHPKPMACIGGHITSDGLRQRFTCCWHSELHLFDLARAKVGCKYDPQRDTWNRPFARVEPERFEPQTIGPVQ